MATSTQQPEPQPGGKVGIVGAGGVGSACAFALALRRSCREIVLVDRDTSRAAGVAADVRYATPLGPALGVRHGEAEDLSGADLVLITAGVNEKSGGATDRSDEQGRLRLLEQNAEIYRGIVPALAAAAPAAVLVVVTDPPDPLADLARDLAGHDRVLSTGTVIDSVRFRFHLAQRLEVDPSAVDAQVVGEHGTSQVMLWSSARVGGAPVADALAERHPGRSLQELREEVEEDVRYANITIIEGNEASQFGIGAVCARITEAVLRDERHVLPVAARSERYGVTVALPSVVGRAGVACALEPEMSDDERARFEHSVETLREAARGIGASGLPT